MCPRQGSNFLLLRQKKVTKEKATRRWRFGRWPNFSAVLGVWGLAPNSLCSLRSRRSDKRREVRLRSVLRTQLQSPALLSSSEGGDEHQIRLAAHRQDEHRALRADAKRGLDRESLRSKRPYCSWAPWEASRSTGVWGRARKRASTTDFARLSERSGRRPRSEFCARPQTPSTAEQLALGRPPPSGRLFFGDFLLAKQ